MTPERQHAMLTMTVENLLDSNVFVRSVALSFERFRGAGSVYSRDDVRKHMQLTASARGASPDQVDDEEWECWGLEDCALQRFLLAHRPQLLTELRLGDTCQAGGVDWGSLHVYTCDASCHVARGYVAEHAAIQNYDLINIPGS